MVADAGSTGPIRIELCADDFAMHPAIDDAVVQLARRGRLSATSCMTTSPRWAEAARTLADAPPTLSTGLHINLTEGHGGTAPTLGAVLIDAYARRLDGARITQTIIRQLDDFEQAMQRAPDFIDGHQHVHQLPVVRDALLAVLAKRYPGGAAPSVRATVPARLSWSFGKAGVLAMLGGLRFRGQLSDRGLRHNRGFAGVYGFDATTPADYGRHMDRWLAGCADGTLMMCHPATALVTGDAIAAARVVEFGYLSSEAFGDALRRYGVALSGCPEAHRRSRGSSGTSPPA
ncbi:ChbG/HpnK family deacetylase [Variovorax sp. RHLX14]|uniref:ChbG/HpnK family deacetylase n=1 Tax=Variovorax sp. RHLX14 TaxID=1259731 RepID=UPI003F44BC6B